MTDYATYTILFERLDETRCAEGKQHQDEVDRVIKESEEIRTVRELAEAASEASVSKTFTRA